MTSTLAGDTFFLPGLDEHRRARTEQIAAVLGSRINTTNPLGLPIADAVAHHLLEGAEQAAHNRDAALLSWYRRTVLRDLAYLVTTGTPDTAHLAVNPAPGDLLRSPLLSETAYYLVRPDTAAVEGDVRKSLAAALVSVHEHGFAPLLAQHAPVICLLSHRDPADTLFSWSITRLPGTVFTDYTDHPEILARDLIHEAGHHWLNEAFALTGTALPDDVTFFSPWRDADRPVFGFLHACWAFSLTVIHASRVLDQGDSPACDFLATYVQRQREMLKEVTNSLPKAFDHIKADWLRTRLVAAIREALAA